MLEIIESGVAVPHTRIGGGPPRLARYVNETLDFRPAQPFGDLSVTVDRQPTGANVTFTAGVSDALTHRGLYKFTVTCGTYYSRVVEVVVYAAGITAFGPISVVNGRTKTAHETRQILQNIAMSLSESDLTSRLETNASASSPWGLHSLGLSIYGGA